MGSRKSGDADRTATPSGAPVRTCVGCRRTDARSRLIRLVRVTGDAGEPVAVVDVRRRMAGRGAWLHPGADCVALAVKRRAIVRALPGVSDAGGVAAWFATATGNEP